MNTVQVELSRKYAVTIGTGLIGRIGERLRSQDEHSRKIAVISDSHVDPLYGESVCDSLSRAGYFPVRFVFPAGEKQKNLQTYQSILNFLAKNAITRGDKLLALGGGVTGDLAGFAAATYLRGISYIQVPTSLLAMADSSVGGKTAIDLPAGKNLAGAFCQPEAVFCDVDTLRTLPAEDFRDGCAEVIKYGILADPGLFAHLHDHGLNFDREYVITRCVENKRDVIVRDEYDCGVRRMLNLGHTVGHAIEADSRYTVSHGKAVAAGICIAARLSRALGLCSGETAHMICSVINDFGLPTGAVQDAATIARYAANDKKRIGDTVNMILPTDIGKCIVYPADVNCLESLIEKGL